MQFLVLKWKLALITVKNNRYNGLTRPKVDDNVNEEDSIREAVEGNPSCTQIVVEKGDGHRQNYKVCYQQKKHTEVPVEPKN